MSSVLNSLTTTGLPGANSVASLMGMFGGDGRGLSSAIMDAINRNPTLANLYNQGSSGSSGGGEESSSGEISSDGSKYFDDNFYLQHYLGNTNVPLTTEQQNIIDLVDSLVTGQYGNYRQMLSGEPNYGLLDLGVLRPQRENLREQVLPQLADIYSGGVGGENYWTGSRQAAQENALYNTFNNEANIRYQAAETAQNRALQAQSMLPSMMGIQNTEWQNDIMNLERTINVHYKNQGLTLADLQLDLQAAQLAISEAGMEGQLALGERSLDLQQQQIDAQIQAQEDANNAGMLGGIGSLLGAGIGALVPGGGVMGAMLGSQLGGSAGLFAGGANTAGYQTMNSGLGNYLSYSMLQNMMGQNSMSNWNQQSNLLSTLGGTSSYYGYNPWSTTTPVISFY